MKEEGQQPNLRVVYPNDLERGGGGREREGWGREGGNGEGYGRETSGKELRSNVAETSYTVNSRAI